jgi:siroheme synthase
MAIVEHASTESQREIYSIASNITAEAEAHQISAPAVIIAGNVVENALPSIEPIIRQYQSVR